MERILSVLKLASKWYPDKKFFHAMRVAEYATDQPLLQEDPELIESLFVVGLLHDILEDTKLTSDELYKCTYIYQDEYDAIEILTHHKEDCSYEDYIKQIVDSKSQLALLVKRADMKDHLMQSDTLSDKLKEKYYPVIKYLL